MFFGNSNELAHSITSSSRAINQNCWKFLSDCYFILKRDEGNGEDGENGGNGREGREGR